MQVGVARQRYAAVSSEADVTLRRVAPHANQSAASPLKNVECAAWCATAGGTIEQLGLCHSRCLAFPALHQHLELLEADSFQSASTGPPGSGLIVASFFAQGDRGTEVCLAVCSG